MLRRKGSGRHRRSIDDVGFWYHSIDLGGGRVTPGLNPLEYLEAEWSLLALPDLQGRTVLDIGAWDGFFSFKAEAGGARRVVALDHYAWSLDLLGQQDYWRRCRDAGVAPRAYHETEFWRPRDLPGKAGFDVAHAELGSSVEARVDDLMTTDLGRLGQFDVVLYLGVLYHMEDPLDSMKRLAAVTRELAVISTQAISVPGRDHLALWEFYPGAELNHDVSNWWAPNMTALHGICRAAGFRDVRTILDLTHTATDAGSELERGRVIVHALK